MLLDFQVKNVKTITVMEICEIRYYEYDIHVQFI